MLEIVLSLTTPSGQIVLKGALEYISNQSGMSSYRGCFDGCPGEVFLENQLQWSESRRGLFARAIALTAPGDALPTEWEVCRVDIALNIGGRQRRPMSIAMAGISHQDGVYTVGWTEGPNSGFVEVQPRHRYDNAWMLAQHALSVSCFGNDEITPIKALDIPVYVVDGVRYIREKDVPSPLLEAFQNHTLYTVRPFVRDVPDAHNAWDLQFFISRNRNWC